MRVRILYRPKQVEEANQQPDIAKLWFGNFRDADWYQQNMIKLMSFNTFATNNRNSIKKRFAVESDSEFHNVVMDWDDKLALKAKEGMLEAFRYVESEENLLGVTLTFELLIP